ncbi:hypothetical protein LMG28688_05642 [Paraburkholderia caffeinitolerans]|uniref:Uncharacterized protein n=1 Tax=Paraburkholderia caffeinitolerans TaxID=1723730 RepID=A0A6J5GQH6_9BURK|nr:hypothetical protein [Paraburkholderia caffeinitolerans]CAB3802788.1 hypothetical protein LMG28688_05642 [Paraburkholderia caffeinitolerans]
MGDLRNDENLQSDGIPADACETGFLCRYVALQPAAEATKVSSYDRRFVTENTGSMKVL